ncbi:hypothetical protein EIP91_002150 [Steccherinum ochraceum]|uniref:Uncharacterized protein n=1 Tax=Steccherinum ochraceum TaxID=92696 RepID=A0A4R0RTG5_9APHY|nr:hypothetical protein EIP91_002150 [Steccherinum ochraceum]
MSLAPNSNIRKQANGLKGKAEGDEYTFTVEPPTPQPTTLTFNKGPKPSSAAQNGAAVKPSTNAPAKKCVSTVG